MSIGIGRSLRVTDSPAYTPLSQQIQFLLLSASKGDFLTDQEKACPNEITPPPNHPSSPRHQIVNRTALANRWNGKGTI